MPEPLRFGKQARPDDEFDGTCFKANLLYSKMRIGKDFDFTPTMKPSPLQHLLPGNHQNHKASAMNKWFRAGIGLCLFATSSLTTQAENLSLRLANDGLAIDAGSMGKFTLNYPVLVGKQWDQVRKPIEKNLAGNTAVLKYDAGEQVEIVLQPGTGELTFTPSHLLADEKTLRCEMLVDFNFANGGTWKIGDGAETPFPAEKPAKPHLFQGAADALRLKTFQGATLTVTAPRYSFQQLTDNREWGWKTFHWQFGAPCGNSAEPLRMKIALSAATAAAKPLVDKFGQNTRVDYPDKVKSEEELKADVQAEAKYLASLHPPTLDAFGGLPGSKEELGLKATGFFHVEKKEARWILVDPAGNAFFHLGICGFDHGDDYTYIKGREQVYEWLPSHDGMFGSAFKPEPYWNPTTVSFHLANRIRKTGQPYDSRSYTAGMIERARKFGFNSAGAFGAGNAEARRQAQFPHADHLPLHTWEGFKEVPGIHETLDPFSDQMRAQCVKNFAATIAPQANDPLIIGYFLANEPFYEDIPRVVPTLNSTFPCKRRLAQMLEQKYKTIAAFNLAWETAFATFTEVAERGLPVKTRAAAADMQEYTGLFLDAYFRVVTSAFHKYDTNHLLIGNRFQSGTINNEQLCRISGKYMDVISFNYYTYHLDKDFLNRIYQWTGGRPMFLSEFYYASPKDSGLPGGAKDVSSQLERGLAYRNYVEQAASLGYVTGIEWFTLVDQPVTGRFFEFLNGESANTGLISVADRPWKAMLAEMMKANYDIYKVCSGERAPYTFNDPRFTASGTGRKIALIPRATGPIKINGLSVNWPGVPAETVPASRLVQGSDAGGLEGTFKLCWDDANLYLLAHIADATPMQNAQKGDMLWNGDAVELFIGWEELEQGGSMRFTDRQILLGAAPANGGSHVMNAAAQPNCEMTVVADVNGQGYTLQAAIPFKALGFTPKEGRQILFDLAIDDSPDGKARTRQLVWNGNARNSGDRTAWGRATFAK